MRTPQEIIDHFEEMRDLRQREVKLFDELEYLLLYKAVWEQFLPWSKDEKAVYNVSTRWEGRDKIWLGLYDKNGGPKIELLFRTALYPTNGGMPCHLYGNPYTPDRFVDILMKRLWGVKEQEAHAVRRRRRGKSGREFTFDSGECYNLVGVEAPDYDIRPGCILGNEVVPEVED